MFGKRICTLLTLSVSGFLTLWAADVTITVTNPTRQQRQEVVAVDLHAVCQKLGASDSVSFVIRNVFGLEEAYQKTYDGKLLLDVTIQPQGKAVYTVTKGNPRPPKCYVRGAMYPKRLDDIAWENDKGAYRVYGPALQRRGEKAFGTDVWVKNTPELVVEQRYEMDHKGFLQRDSLNKIGKKSEAREVGLLTSFHLDQGNGMDAYSVGPTLGCGAPALMKDNKLIFPYCYETYKILDNGPLRFSVSLEYAPNKDGIREHRLITLDKGSHFNQMTVWYDHLKEPMSLVSGVVLHDDKNIVLGKNYVHYADPTDNPSRHNSLYYVAVLFPQGVNQVTIHRQSHSHAIGIVNGYHGERYTYYFGSAWSRYDVPSQAHWQLCIDDYLNQLQHPLNIQIQ